MKVAEWQELGRDNGSITRPMQRSPREAWRFVSKGPSGQPPGRSRCPGQCAGGVVGDKLGRVPPIPPPSYHTIPFNTMPHHTIPCHTRTYDRFHVSNRSSEETNSPDRNQIITKTSPNHHQIITIWGPAFCFVLRCLVPGVDFINTRSKNPNRTSLRPSPAQYHGASKGPPYGAILKMFQKSKK